MNKIINDDALRGTAHVKDNDREVIKNNNYSGRDKVKEKTDHSSNVNNYSYLDKNNSRYKNTGYNSKQEKNTPAYKKNYHNQERTAHDDYSESNKLILEKSDHEIIKNQDSSSTIKASTGQAAEMILDKGNMKDNIISLEAKQEAHLSKIRNLKGDKTTGTGGNTRYSKNSEDIIKKKRRGIINNKVTEQNEGNDRYSSELSSSHKLNDSVAKAYQAAVNSTIGNDNENDLGSSIGQRVTNEISRTPQNAARTWRSAKTVGRAGKYTLNSGYEILTGNKKIHQVLFEKNRGIIGTKPGLSRNLKEAIINAKGNGDLGIDTAIRTKDTIVKSSRTIKTTAKTGKLAAKAAAKTTRNLYAAFRVMGRLLINPVVLKALLIIMLSAIVIFAFIGVISGIISIYSALTYTSKKEDLNDTWKYITELDANLEYDFYDTENKIEWNRIDYFHYSMNQYPITDASQMIAYLTSKYDDFKFNDVKDEIKSIHDALYDISYNEWTHEDCSSDEEGNNSCTTYYHLDVNLDGIPFQSWLMMYGGLNESQMERYNTTLAIGGTTMLAEFGNPFIGTNWQYYISSRYGYRVHPLSGEVKFHEGIDIAMPTGTPINSVSSGTVTTGSDSTRGNYVIVTKTGKKNMVELSYYHLDSISVSNGQIVAKGDVLGTVGNTGASDGAHLHLEYKVNGEPYNPWFYVEGGNGGLGPIANNTVYTPNLIGANGWAWPTESTRITSGFGYRPAPCYGCSTNHQAIDIGASTPGVAGDPVWSMADGVVTYAGLTNGGGLTVYIDHGNGVTTRYMHLESLNVISGQPVKQGTLLGGMGGTGGTRTNLVRNAYGVHLDFQIKINGVTVDPTIFF